MPMLAGSLSSRFQMPSLAKLPSFQQKPKKKTPQQVRGQERGHRTP